MSQQFLEPSLYSDGSSIASAHNVSHAPTKLPSKQAQISSAQSVVGFQETDNTSNPRFSKRKKVTNNQGSHKFVSQKRWKFSDGQPWPPSKLSSKAQNASKTVHQSKVENVSPDRDSIPQALPMGRRMKTDVVQPHPSLYQKDTFRMPLPQPQPQLSLREFRSEPQSSRVDGKAAMQPSSPASIKGSSVSTDVSTRQEPQNLTVNTNTEILYMQRPNSPGSTNLAADSPRSSRSRKALSLEKDSQRIAALIAEKRKENESSMFRERMLQRQLQHKNQSSTGRYVRENCDAQVPDSLYSSPPNTDSRQASKRSLLDDTTIPTSQLDDSMSFSPLTTDIQSQSSARKQFLDRRRRSSKDNLDYSAATSQPQGTVDRQSIAYSNPKPRSPIRSEREILFGKDTPPKNTDGGHSLQGYRRNHVGNAVALPVHESVSFEVERADVASQLIAFSNRIVLKESINNVPIRTTNVSQQPRPQHRGYQTSNLLATAQSQDLQRTNSTPSTSGRASVEAPTYSIPSPASALSSQSQTSMTSQQFAHPNISAHPYRTTPNDSNFGQGRPMSAGQLSTNTSLHSLSRGQAWNSPEMHVEPPDSHRQTFNFTPYHMMNGLNKASGRSMASQQPCQPRSMPSSNTNMFSGNPRTSTNNNSEGANSKERVNMFSNTKGTPFPMHEVIRQIEMT